MKIRGRVMNDTTFQGNGKITYVPIVVDAKPKPITNAMKIRSMSDEELAEWLDKLITHCNDGPCFNCFMQKACLTSMLDWLRQEVNDGKEEKEENQPAK